MEVKPRIFFYVVNTIMLVLFSLALTVQYNDPDGPVWMLIYGYAFVVTAIAYQRVAILLTGLGAAVYLVGGLYHFPVLEDRFIETEAAREAGGLLFCAAWMIVLSALWFWSWRQRSGMQEIGAES